MQHRRLLIFSAIVSLFGFGIIIWYFLFSSPEPAPTLGETVSPFSFRDVPTRLGFIFQGGDPPEQTTETEVTLPGAAPFVNVWDKPSTGNAIVIKSVLREIVASSTSTTSPQVMKTVRATSTILMFVDRSTGYIHGYEVESGSTYQISNTTLPGIYDAYIFAGGTRVLMRYLDSDKVTIVSLLASIPDIQKGRDPQPLSFLTYLPNNIRSVAISDSSSLLSYLISHSSGSSIYTIRPKGTEKIGESSFSEWKLSYGGEDLYATTLPSAYLEGVTVSLPSFSRVVGGKTGLMSIPSKGSGVLNGMWSSSGLVLFGTSGGKNTVLNIKTLPEKCEAVSDSHFICAVPDTIPTTNEGLPDDWYQGAISFDDRLMIVYPFRGETYSLYSFEKKYQPMDVTNFSLSKQADLISFIRKNDGTLWLLNTNLLADEQ